MSKNNRSDIKTNISRWELFLIIIHLVVITLQIVYYILHWKNIPEIILTNSHRGRNQDKIEFVYGSITGSFVLMVTTICYSFYAPKYGYSTGWKGRSLSKDITKAEQQYKIEISNLLCISMVMHLCWFINNIIGIEKQIKFGVSGDNWTPLLQALVAMLFSWSIHHILWTKLADKS